MKISAPTLRPASETRLLRLAELQREFDEVLLANGESLRGRFKAFAKKLELNDKYYGHLRSGFRKMGNDLARRIEVACDKPANWLDTPRHKVVVSATPNGTPTERIIQDLAQKAFQVDAFATYSALLEIVQRKRAA